MKKCKVAIYGRNLERVINSLLNRNINISKLNFYDDSITLEVSFNDYKKITTLYEKSSYKIQLLYKPEHNSLKELLMKNLGLMLAVVLMFVLTMVYSSSIWQFRIYGTENISQAQVLKVLKSSGIKQGTNKTTIDKEKISSLLVANIDGVALASVNIVGTTLVITISENINNDKLLNNEETICSPYDCKITSIKTISGTALVKVGDKVAKGQTLVGNYITDETGQTTKATAKAEIYADVYMTYTKTFFEQEQVLVKSGKKMNKNQVSLFNFSLSKSPKTPYKHYETQTNIYYLDSPLPIKIKEITYFELIEKSITNDLTNVQLLEQKAIEEAKNQLNISAYDDLTTNLQNLGEKVVISVSFVTNMKIA